MEQSFPVYYDCYEADCKKHIAKRHPMQVSVYLCATHFLYYWLEGGGEGGESEVSGFIDK